MMGMKWAMGLFSWKRAGIFALGAAAGVVGSKLLTSKTAKGLYAEAAAAALRAKDKVMETASCVQAHAADVMAQARQINADREAQEADEL